MRLLFTLSLVTLCGCSDFPSVNVKKDWIKSIASFQFVPLYPMRGGISVGDIRMHRLSINNTGLNSRTLGRVPDLPVGAVKKVPMALPKIDVTREAHANFEASGLIGLWNSLVGVKFDKTEILSVALTNLTTAEIADANIVASFETSVVNQFTDRNKLKALCVGAKVMGDPRFEDTAISVITRVGLAKGIEYRRSNETIVTVNSKTNNTGNENKADADGETTTTKTTTLSTLKNFDVSLAFGVDAIMIDPVQLYDSIPKEYFDESAPKQKSLVEDW